MPSSAELNKALSLAATSGEGPSIWKQWSCFNLLVYNFEALETFDEIPLVRRRAVRGVCDV